jgi:hypothetical protein
MTEKEILVDTFSQELSKIINGFSVIYFLDVSGFNPTTFTGVSQIIPTQEKSFFIIPIIHINGYDTPVPIAVNPKHYDNFLLFLKYIVSASCYYTYTEDIYNSVNSRLQAFS